MNFSRPKLRHLQCLAEVRHAVVALRGLREGLSLALDQADANQLRVAVGPLPNMGAADAVWFAPQGAVEGPLKRGELALLAFYTAVTEGAVGFTVRRNDEIAEGARHDPHIGQR